MRAVWKYDLSSDLEQRVFLPVGAVIRYVALQHGEIKLWAEVDPHSTGREIRTIVIAGTGTSIPNGLTYVNSLLIRDGEGVFHVYAG